MPYLRHDIYSHVSNQLYGKAGDEVVIVADHDNVQIVAGRNGFRFPVATITLTNQPGDLDMAYVTPEVTYAVNRKPTRKKKVLSNTQQLF